MQFRPTYRPVSFMLALIMCVALLGVVSVARAAPLFYEALPDEIDINRYDIVVIGDDFTRLPATAPEGEHIDAVLQRIMPLQRFGEKRNGNARGSEKTFVVSHISQSEMMASGVLSQFEEIHAKKADIAVIALGQYDAHYQSDIAILQETLSQLIESLKKEHAYVLLAGSQAPSHVPTGYAARFNAVISQIAAKHSVVLMPNFLKGVHEKAGAVRMGARLDYPNAKGIEIIAQNLAPYISDMVVNLEKIRKSHLERYLTLKREQEEAFQMQLRERRKIQGY